MEIILRHKAEGMDRCYIIIGTCIEGEYHLSGLWGKWSTFEKAGHAGLRSQVKYCGTFYPVFQDCVTEILQEKLGKGYKPINAYWLPDFAGLVIQNHGHKVQMAWFKGTQEALPAAPMPILTTTELKAAKAKVEKPEPSSATKPIPARPVTRAAYLEL